MRAKTRDSVDGTFFGTKIKDKSFIINERTETLKTIENNRKTQKDIETIAIKYSNESHKT